MREIYINPVTIRAPCSGTQSPKNGEESCSRAVLSDHNTERFHIQELFSCQIRCKGGGVGERDAGKLWVVSSSLQVMREGQERKRMTSSPLGAKRGDRETLPVCAQHPDLHTHYYKHLSTHTHRHTHLLTDFEVTFWKPCVSTGQVRTN